MNELWADPLVRGRRPRRPVASEEAGPGGPAQTRGSAPQICLGLAALALAAFASACRQDMHNQPKYIPLRPSEFFEDGRSARPLPEGTVARGHLNDDTAF